MQHGDADAHPQNPGGMFRGRGEGHASSADNNNDAPAELLLALSLSALTQGFIAFIMIFFDAVVLILAPLPPDKDKPQKKVYPFSQRDRPKP